MDYCYFLCYFTAAFLTQKLLFSTGSESLCVKRVRIVFTGFISIADALFYTLYSLQALINSIAKKPNQECAHNGMLLLVSTSMTILLANLICVMTEKMPILQMYLRRKYLGLLQAIPDGHLTFRVTPSIETNVPVAVLEDREVPATESES